MFKKFIICLPVIVSGCAVPVFGGLGGLGLSAVEDRGLEGVASDQALRISVNSALFDNYDFIGLNLTVYKERILLTGFVPHEQAKIQAVQIVKNTSGVKDVIDAIKIQPDDEFLEIANDTWLTTKLKTNLYMNQDIYAPNYIVHTFASVVYIFGTASSPEELGKVMEEAHDVEGVRKVVNLIELKEKA